MLLDEELQYRSNCINRMHELERCAAEDLKQKARIKWTMDGDENSTFFHGVVNNQNRKNHIDGLMINGKWSNEVEEIKKEVFNFFQNKFNERWVSRPKLVNSRFKSIDMMDAIRIEAPFSIDEVKKATWACGSDKAPGHDGLTFKFIKRYWDVIKDDLMCAIRKFEDTGTLSKGCNSSFITLAPKAKDPIALVDFRPISLIGCIYKIISKVLATRLKSVIRNVIDEAQSAYVEGRSILDGPLVVNELCTWAKNTKKKMLLFKVDFDKAFDSVNWEYLDSVLD